MKFVCPLIAVQDMQRSRYFYENILGQKVKYDFGEDVTFEGDFSIHLADHYRTLLPEGLEVSPVPSNSFELYFETDELESVWKRLSDEKVEFLHEIVEQPWAQRVMRLYDPDKHIIEIGESLESVVLRLHRQGLSPGQISQRSSMPIEFVEKTIRESG